MSRLNPENAKFVFCDTETYLIGPGAVVPKLVCASFIEDGESKLLSTADPELEQEFDRLFTAGNGIIVVFHNASFDVPVIYRAFPKLQSKIWAKIEAEEITDTMLREQLLNLATHGKLDMFTAPDGSNKRLLYGLDALVMNYTGVDISESKSGDDSVRKNFALLDGLPAGKYPANAREYALDDVEWTNQVFYRQETRSGGLECNNPETVGSALDAARFHTSAAIALMFVTERGMATDEAEFNRLCAHLDAELSDANMKPLIDAKLMEPSLPPMPYKQDDKKARELLAEWFDILPEDVNYKALDEGMQQALVDAGIRIKAGTKPSIKTKELKRYVVAALIAKQRHKTVDAVLQMVAGAEEAVALADELGVVMEKTDGGDVSTAGSIISSVADAHPVLKTYQHRQKLQKLVSTEIPRMMWDGKLSPVVHFPFKAILETGRTSSGATDKYPSANGQNVDPRARGVYVPRPGYVLCSCDYSALELVCVAQTTYRMFGKSVHRDRIIEGYDLHAYLGMRLAIEMASPEFAKVLQDAGISPEDLTGAYKAFKNLGENNKLYKFWRKLAKPVGLGFPSGLGAATMVELAMKDPYNIDMLTLAEDRYQTHPHEFELQRLAFHAKKLHGMTKENLAWTPMLKAVAFAMRLRSIWLTVYPEMVLYFAAIKEMRDSSGERYFMTKEGKAKYEAHYSEWLYLELLGETNEPPPDPEDYGGTDLLCYTTPLKMHRARCTYTAVSNGLSMQSPGAEGAKAAVIKTVKACLDPASKSPLANGGGFVVDFIHDELLVEIKEDGLTHDRAMAVKDCMEDGLRRVITDVPVKAQPVLMRRWSKDAVEVRDASGRLAVWEP